MLFEQHAIASARRIFQISEIFFEKRNGASSFTKEAPSVTSPLLCED
jgi:hypothetical protein